MVHIFLFCIDFHEFTPVKVLNAVSQNLYGFYTCDETNIFLEITQSI